MLLIWLDTETADLDPLKHAVLELAVGIADLAAPFDLKTMDRFVLRYTDSHTYGMLCGEPGSEIAGLGMDNGPCAACNFSLEARAMHEKSGLLAECARSPTTMGEVEAHLLTLIEGEPERGDDKPKAQAHRALEDVAESVDHAQRCVLWLLGERPKRGLVPLGGLERVGGEP